MSTLVTNEFCAKVGRGDDVANPLIEILGERLQFEGCETIRIARREPRFVSFNPNSSRFAIADR